MDNKKLLGNRIRMFREAKGLTQEELAEEIGCSVDFVSLCERGANFPSLHNCERLSQAFGITLPELFAFEGRSIRKDGEKEKALNRLRSILMPSSLDFINFAIGVIKSLKAFYEKKH